MLWTDDDLLMFREWFIVLSAMDALGSSVGRLLVVGTGCFIFCLALSASAWN